MSRDANSFLGVSIVSCIVFAVASSLLAILVYKGWKTNSMRGYTLIYLCLANITLVWACQIPIAWIDSDKLVHSLSNVLKLMPISTFLFSLKYFKVVTSLVPSEKKTKCLFQLLVILAIGSALVLIGLWITLEFDILKIDGSFIIAFEMTVGVFACIFLTTTMILVKRFCDQLSESSGLLDS
jgi:hypothetical protein